jgi:MscS family membrane protein
MEYLLQVIWGNETSDYIWTGAIILFFIILNPILGRYLARLLAVLFRRQWKTFDEKTFTELVVHPLGIFLAVTVSIMALYRLNFPPQAQVVIYGYSLQKIFLSIAAILQVITFIWLLLRIIDFIAFVLEKRANLTTDMMDNQLVVFFKDFFKVIVCIIGLLMILHFAFSYHIGSLLTGLSIVGAAIALALRESLENLIASFVIFFDKPFIQGDTVKVQNVTGTVERIGLRSTRLRSDQKTYVTVPNKQMVDSILDNHSQRTQQRNELMLQVSLNTPSEKIEELMNEIRVYLAQVREIEHFNVIFLDINVQAYTIQVEFFLPAAYVSMFNSTRQKLNLFALQTMEKMKIRIAGMDKEIVTR